MVIGKPSILVSHRDEIDKICFKINHAPVFLLFYHLIHTIFLFQIPGGLLETSGREPRITVSLHSILLRSALRKSAAIAVLLSYDLLRLSLTSHAPLTASHPTTIILRFTLLCVLNLDCWFSMIACLAR